MHLDSAEPLPDPPESPDVRSNRIAGLVARVIASAVHSAIIHDELAKTRKGQTAIAEALLEFARSLANNHVGGTGHLIEAAKLARNASDLIGRGGA